MQHFLVCASQIDVQHMNRPDLANWENCEMCMAMSAIVKAIKYAHHVFLGGRGLCSVLMC